MPGLDNDGGNADVFGEEAGDINDYPHDDNGDDPGNDDGGGPGHTRATASVTRTSRSV